MKRKFFFSVFCFLALFFPLLVSACEKGVPVVSKDGVRLTGILHKESHWGPPNFGETPELDSKFDAWVVYVDHEFNVMADTGTKETSLALVKNIQIYSNDEVGNEKLKGKRVFVEGRIWGASTPGDVTDFNISVIKIYAVKNALSVSCLESKQ